MKNLTITLPDDVYARLRVDAAKAGKSMSRYVSEKLALAPEASATQVGALEAWLTGPGFPGLSENWTGREAIYAEREETLLRRHELADLRDRPEDRSTADPDERPDPSPDRG
jgi:hypothetical protein